MAITGKLLLMTSYLAITCLKHSVLHEQQLRIFLSYLPQEQLKEYLFHSKIYNGKKNRSKHELIDTIITGKDNKSTQWNDDVIIEDAKKVRSRTRSDHSVNTKQQ